MGLFSKVFSKEACEICGKEEGILGRTKLQDGKYICSDCMKNTSSYFHAARYNFDEFKKHLAHMERENELYEKVYKEIPDERKVIEIRNFSEGIIFADDIAMFEIVNHKTKQKNKKELFRYDQIWDFKMYTKPSPEGSNYKYSEVGVKIKMLSEKDEDPAYVLASDTIKNHRHPYMRDEIELKCKSNCNEIEGGMIRRHLEDILGLKLETKITVDYANTTRTEYRNFAEVGKSFNREKYSQIADEAERNLFGKTIKELDNE